MKDQPKGLPAPTPPVLKQKEGLVKMNFEPILKNLRLKPNKGLISQIRSGRKNNQFISLVLMDGVQLMPEMILPLFEVLQKIGKTENLDVFLYTTGGHGFDCHCPSEISSLADHLHRRVDKSDIPAGIAPRVFIIAGKDATLGPVDPTTKHPLLPRDKNDRPIPVSVEDLKNCIKFIAQQLKDQGEDLKYTPTDMTNIVSKLFEHIEPLAIGAVERAYGLSRLITRKVLETHLDPSKDKEKIEAIVNKIGGEYFSHSFPITRRDAEQELKLKVEKPDADLFSKIWALYEYYRGAFSVQHDLQINIEQKDPKGVIIERKGIPLITRILGFLDSETERRVLLQLQSIKKEGAEIKPGPIFTGWVKPSAEELPVDNPNYFLVVLEKPVPQQPPLP